MTPRKNYISQSENILEEIKLRNRRDFFTDFKNSKYVEIGSKFELQPICGEKNATIK